MMKLIVLAVLAVVAVASSSLAQRSTPIQLPQPAGAASDQFGSAVAIDGDTMIVGAPFDDVGANVDQGSAYIYRWTGNGWTLEATLTAAGGAASDFFGFSVAVSGDAAIVGAYGDNVGAIADQGSAYVFTRSGTTWTQRAQLTAAEGATLDRFGYSVALSRDSAIVGAYGDNVGANADQGSAYVFTRSGTGWTQQARLNAADGAASDEFGLSVAISGDTAIVGAYADNVGANTDQGSAYVFTRSGTTWTQQARLTATGGAASDFFGRSVTISGDTAVVGAILDDVGANADQGSAYVFTRSGATWTQQAQLTALDGAAIDRLGYSVAISRDTVIVGAYLNNVGSSADEGSAYIFTRSGGTWTQRAQLTSPFGAASDEFGFAVALFGDTAIVGGHLDDVDGRVDQGSAWVFSRVGSSWIGPDLKLLASDGAANDELGSSVAISGDTAIVGAYRDDVGFNNLQGSAYVFTRSGTVWTEQARLTASDGASSDGFGSSVAISGDTVVVGAFADGVTFNDQGSAYVFTRAGTTWTEQARLTAADAAALDYFGVSVAISGETVIVGAYLDDIGASTDQGSAYIYTRSGTTWTQQAKLTATDGAPVDTFGCSVAISGDTALVGVRYDDVGANTDQGSARVFTRSGTAWTEQGRLTAADGAANDQFGLSVALSGDTAIAGAHQDDVGANNNQGSAYIFTRSGTTWTQQARLNASDGAANDWFGYPVALSGDVAIVGAILDDVNFAADPGSAYIFTRAGTNWTQQERLNAADGIPGDQFAFAVAVSGDTAIVGSNLDNNGANIDQGSAWVFDIAYDDFSLASNASTDTSATTLAAALGSALNGHQIAATPAAWRLASLLDTTGRSLTLRSTSDLRMPYTSSLTLGGISSLASGAGRPLEFYGGLSLPGPGTRTINAAQLTLWTQATLTAGIGAELGLLSGHFNCAINSNTRYDMSLATLQVEGMGSEQTLEVMSTDIGADAAGLDRTIAGHYPIGTLHIGPSPSTVRLVDAHDNDGLGQGACEAIYVDTLIIEAGSRLINTTCRIYYNTLISSGTVDVPGNLVPLTPQVSCDYDYNQDENVDLLDAQQMAQVFVGLLTPESNWLDGDLNGDENADLTDAQILAAYVVTGVCGV